MNHNPRSVVVGVDGTAAALQAVRWAAGVAVRDDVPLRLVHVYEVPLGLPMGIAQQESLLKDMREQGRRWIAEARNAVAEVDPALPTEVVLAPMPVVKGLLRESETASLLVLGTRGLGALTGLLAGSTSVAVAGNAQCPVAVVRGANHDEPPRVAGPVVVGVDGAAVSDSAIALAFAEAAARDAELVAVHAWTESVFEAELADSTVDLAVFRQRAQDMLGERLAGWQEKYPEVRVRREVVRDRPGRALRRFSYGAQLVVVARRGRAAVRSLVLGSTSLYLLHHAACPVVVTRNETQ